MDKKSVIVTGIFLIVIASLASLLSVPQFLIFQGNVKLDGRIVPEGTVVNFSIEGMEIASANANASGEYGSVFIQGFLELYGKPINITINNYEVEQKIDYVYPQDIFLNLSALTENALKITESFPVEKTLKFRKPGVQVFNISALSGYGDEINYSIFVDGDLISESNSYIYVIENSDKGAHEIVISTTDGFLIASKEWEIVIERPEVKSFDGDTTDFDSIGLNELENVENVILEKTGKGKIEFLESLNLSGITDLNNKIKIERGIVAIDTSFYPQLNKPAKITLTGVNYNTIPEIFYTEEFTINSGSVNKKCEFCHILNYTKFPTTNGEIVFEVEHFSSFKTGNSGHKYNLSLFNDLDTCKFGIVGDLDLDLREPDENDEFKPGDEIKVKIDVENNADEEKDIVVEAVLYNINRNDIEEEIEEEKDINNGRDKSFELILRVPDDFENDNYIVFVKAYEDHDEESQCVEGTINIALRREKHEVIIKDISMKTTNVSQGKNLQISVEVQNIGRNDEENVHIEVEISDLDIIEKGETFELEEFGEDDSYLEILSVKIPENARVGDYTVRIKAVFDDGEDRREEKISIFKTVITQREIISLENKKLIETESKKSQIEIPLFIPEGLFIGIVTLLILIIIVALKKK